MKDKLHIRFLWLLVPFLAASCIYLFLYQYNNKYTRTTIQPANGLLILSEKELQTDPVRFLKSGWSFYPDQLLSPEDFSDGIPDSYQFYTQIGQRSHFHSYSLPDSPHGYGTYVLWLSLPAEQSYTLELPEIFSACRLYVDDQLVLTLGDPDPAHYIPRIQERLITFTSTGMTRLILCVSDYSHYYSGMVYPPAFGLSHNVELYHNLRIGICIAFESLALLIAVLALFLGLHSHQKNILIFAVLCISIIGFTAYPLFHTFLIVPVFPWYSLELFSGYVVAWLVLVLHNRLCSMDQHLCRISQGTALIVCTIALCYGLTSASLTVPVMNGFSILTTWYKAFCVLYLLASSADALSRRQPDTLALFCGDVFYGTAFLWDLLLPAYEPVYGGWLTEWGTLILFLCMLYTLWHDITQAYIFRYSFQEERRQLTRQVAIQQSHYLSLTEKIDETIRMRHDQRHHMQLLRSCLEHQQYEQMKEYLNEYEDSYELGERTVLCRNLVIDAILQYYHGLCQKQQIRFAVDAQLPADLPVSDIDLSILFGNLLENAYDACKEIAAPAAYIQIKAGWQNEKLYFRIENSYKNLIHKHQDKYLSTKHEGYGVGTESVKALTERYHGQIKFDVTDQFFLVSVILGSTQS